jgi:membrane-associated phospholipid phosphatase
MPSLHVGWAVVVAVGAIVVLRSPWRWLFVLHPVLTMYVVVVTGNHYWMDGIIATVIVAVAAAIAMSWLPEEQPDLVADAP